MPYQHGFQWRKIVNLDNKMPRSMALLSIALLPAFVNGTELSAAMEKQGPEVKSSTTTVGFGALIEEVRAEGKPKVFEGITRFSEIPKGSPTRRRFAAERDTLDGHRRQFSVILEFSTTTPKPTHVELIVEEKDHLASISNQHYLLLNLDGNLKQCGVALGPLDKNGKIIPGPSLAPFKYLDIKAPETSARLKRELDFWLKGIGRKPPAPPAGEEIPR